MEWLLWFTAFVFNHPLVVIGALAVLFFWGRRGGWGRKVARGLLLSLAIACTVLVLFFVYLGFAMRWSTDGPGLLLIFIGIGVFGLLAVAAWVLWAVRRRTS